MRYIPSSPAVSRPPPRSSQLPPESDPSFADASSSSSADPPSSSSDGDEDGVDEEAAVLGRSLYENAIATSAAPTPTSKVIGGAGRLGVGVKTRTPTATAVPKKAKIAEKVEEPGDGAYNAAAVTNGRAGGGGARKGIDRKAGAKGTKMIKGKGMKFDKGKVVKFAGLEEVGEGKENVEGEGKGKRMRVPTEKVMLAMQ